MTPVGRLFIFGLGYTGLHVADVAQRCGWQVSGVCRSDGKARELRERQIDAHALGEFGDGGGTLDLAGRTALAASTHILATIPTIPGTAGDPVLRLHADTLLAASAAGSLCWAGYLSTTGVYGDHAGAWVDELSEARAPPGSGAAARLDAERDWLDLRRRSDGRLKSHVFRLAGIYGPRRSALDTVVRAAAASSVADSVAIDADSFTASVAAAAAAASPPKYVSRVHVDDIAATILASMAGTGHG